MARNNRNAVRLHPNGQRHIAIRDVETVYGSPRYRIAMHIWESIVRNAKRSTKVTAKQVQAALTAEDRWEALSVLHDIDTQWGACPGGGMLDVAGGGSDW